MNASNIPVIAAFGEIEDRPVSLEVALEPVALMAAALRRADADAGGTLLARVDSIDIVNQITWPYADPARSLCDRLGIAPARGHYGAVGGETPIAFIQDAAGRIARGESLVSVVCGGEAHKSAARARADGFDFAWTPAAANPAQSIRGQDTANPAARDLGIHIPATVYPLYENAQAHHWGQTPREALQESGALWAGLSRVAAENPYAAIRAPKDALEIITATSANRMIATPYTKLQVANIMVNQGAAVILTSLALAQELGLDDGRLLFVQYGNKANEPTDHLQRPTFTAVAARDAVLEDAQARYPSGFEAIELYSCFPCVTKAAVRTLGLPMDFVPSVTGGLTFFGAPLNNYMTHAVCAMARKLRETPGRGLLYGQGGFATKHRGLVVGTAPGGDGMYDTDLQARADATRGPLCLVDQSAAGPATLETFTIVHAREGGHYGAVVVRSEQGQRAVARVDTLDQLTMAALENADQFPIGMNGTLFRQDGDQLHWRI